MYRISPRPHSGNALTDFASQLRVAATALRKAIVASLGLASLARYGSAVEELIARHFSMPATGTPHLRTFTVFITRLMDSAMVRLKCTSARKGISKMISDRPLHLILARASASARLVMLRVRRNKDTQVDSTRITKGRTQRHRAGRREFPWPARSAARYEVLKAALEEAGGHRLDGGAVLEIVLWFAEMNINDLRRRYS